MNLSQIKHLSNHYSTDLCVGRKRLKLGVQSDFDKKNACLLSIQHEEARLEDKAFQKLMGKDAAVLRKHLARTPATITFNEAVAGIQKLQSLHTQMDNAVLEAYGWSDINLRHDFYEVDYLPENDRIRFTIHPEARREVLKLLLSLNHKIHAEEVAKGLWEKKGKPGKAGKKQDGQMGLNLL